MNGLSNVKIPKEAYDALTVVKEVIGDGVIAVTLYGSAVSGGLKKRIVMLTFLLLFVNY
ncbi:hypothetical protein JCM19055_3185 [Geomicrobium sp. JCM 19055]|nr:hypothetical protein JCM19055_3185 [Geomicrobium sp. JCM 19055]